MTTRDGVFCVRCWFDSRSGGIPMQDRQATTVYRGDALCAEHLREASTTQVSSAQPPMLVAFYSDFSELAVFDSEVDALRYAVDKGMQVLPVYPGRGLHEQINDYHHRQQTSRDRRPTSEEGQSWPNR